MRNFRVRVRDEKAAFFEELMRYLDFCDYESVESFSESRIYPGFNFKEKEGEGKPGSKGKSKRSSGEADSESNFNNLREVMAKIEAMRDKSKK